jgi:peptidyl-prolyl cis-trans isomerase SurA
MPHSNAAVLIMHKPRVLLVAVALLAAACRSTSAPPAPPVSADTWATVNGTAITQADVDRSFRQTADPAQALSSEEELTAKLGVLDDLILETILLGRAHQQNLQVADADVDKALADAKKNQPEEAFQRELTARKLTVADIRAGIQRRLLAQKVLDRDVSGRIAITDQQIIDFFNANRAQFNLPEDAYHLAQIIVTPVREPQQTNSTGDDAATPEAARAKVTMLMQRLQEGTPFADVARAYSEDAESAARGGDLGMVPLSSVKQAPPAIRDAVLQTEPGRAKVVNQGGAVTIIYVVSHDKAGQRDLSTPGVKQQISDALKARREQLLRTAYLTAARSDATVVNYAARRVVASDGKSAEPSTTPK